jgi:Arc/MetJ family transcription regulator
MKITLNVNDDLLREALKAARTPNKTAVIDLALRAFVHRAALQNLLRRGLEMSAPEIKNAIAADYDLMALRAAEKPAKPYGGKSRSRR